MASPGAQSWHNAKSAGVIADNIGEENIKKVVLLTDVSSNVLGCEKMGQEFLEKMVARGMRFSNTIEW